MTSIIPSEWKCSITLEIMKEPVICSDGHTYEREAIEQWLITNNNSPMTRLPIDRYTLTPNIALRNLIQEGQNSTKITSIPYIPSKVSHNYKLTKCDDGATMIHLNFSLPKENENRNKAILILVIDVSGSMAEKVSIANKDDMESKGHGFTRLDLVKHSIKTVIPTLNIEDYLCIIVFTDTARVLLPITSMNLDGRNLANRLVDNIKAEYTTNLWDGLRLAINLINENKELCKDKNVFTVLLTDGISSKELEPPRGIETTLTNYIKDKSLKGTISAFGYSNDINSAILNNIATICNGIFAFIPDASMVGTVFVNYIANCLSCARDCLEIKVETNGQITKTYGDPKLGMFQYGQPRDIIFEVTPCDEFYFSYTIDEEIVQVKIDKETISSTFDNETKVQLARFNLIEKLSFAITKPIEEANRIILDIVSNLEEVNFDSRIIEMIKDFQSTNPDEGQITKAFSSEEWKKRWGIHYIRSLIKAHYNQQCINFKDPGVQIYGGELFHKIREIAENVFCSLPPPKPIINDDYDDDAPVYRSLSSHVPVQPAAVTSMRDYYDRGGGCFGGNSIVHIKGNKFKLVSEIEKEDILSNGAKVECVIKIIVTSGQKQMVDINGLSITKWHPIIIDGEWIFPVERTHAYLEKIDMVYNFVLDSKHIITINDIKCCTLGHNFTDNCVISHPYYGTDKIINDLSMMNGWKEGKITINDNQFIRENNQVSGIIL
jgi:Mg-chelatase subunit ChlD